MMKGSVFIASALAAKDANRFLQSTIVTTGAVTGPLVVPLGLPFKTWRSAGYNLPIWATGKTNIVVSSNAGAACGLKGVEDITPSFMTQWMESNNARFEDCFEPAEPLEEEDQEPPVEERQLKAGRGRGGGLGKKVRFARDIGNIAHGFGINRKGALNKMNTQFSNFKEARNDFRAYKKANPTNTRQIKKLGKAKRRAKKSAHKAVRNYETKILHDAMHKYR